MAALAILLLASCRKEAPHVISVVKDHYTVSEQKRLGIKVDSALSVTEFVMAPEEAPRTYEYLQTLYDMVVQTPGVTLRDSLDWKVVVLKDNSHYKIFISPSGKLYVTTGLLLHLDAENQLVCLLAHLVYYAETGKAFALIKDHNDPLEVGKVVLGEPSERIDEMAKTLRLAAYDHNDVLAADAFQIDLLCPFNYNVSGLIDIYSDPQVNASLVQNMPWSDERKAHIAVSLGGCGDTDSLFVGRYRHFKDSIFPN